MPDREYLGRVVAVSSSMPPMIILAKTFLERPLLKVPDEVSVAPSGSTTPLSLATPSTASTSSSLINETNSIRRRRVVSRAWLQSDRRVRIKMTSNSLYSRWDAALLLLHGRRALPPHLLLVHARLLGDCIVIRGRHLCGYWVHRNLTVWIRLRSVCRWVSGMVR